mgnify:CR=1 FL=1
MISVDLNCDMGESFGAWTMGSDAELMDHVSSVNIACGFHAGDPSTMRKTVETAIEKSVAIGAHPSYPDLQGFGRRNMSLSPQEVFDIVLYQVAALKGICEASGTRLRHVKPHGALYNQAAKDIALASSISEAIRKIDDNLIVFGLSGSFLIAEAEKQGLRTASEAFADRTYQVDGSLTSRSLPDALIIRSEIAAQQALQLILDSTVTTICGEIIPIKADTICIHGDGEHAIEFARTIKRTLTGNNISISAPWADSAVNQ